MADLLDDHPDICGLSKKEPHFFDHDENWERGAAYYAKTFDGCPSNSITFDATPVFAVDNVPMRMKDIFEPDRFKQLKFLLILREPIAREYSYYQYRLRACEEWLRTGNFEYPDFAR